jgi:hypothetical protein
MLVLVLVLAYGDTSSFLVDNLSSSVQGRLSRRL